MCDDGVDVPCSTQLTIGDVAIPIPNYAAHPERVTWAPPGVDHTAPYLHARPLAYRSPAVDGTALSNSAADGHSPRAGDAIEENMFFSVQDPLTRSYLRWIAQKEQLGQDMCLLGDPGPAMRWLVMLYSHLTRREIRVVYLNSDITESDLKQRREIRNGSLVYDDQSAVSAAVEGQLLVLEGLERVERNVLPVVNNLLENREMHLDNGSVLIHPARYDALLHKLYESKLQQEQQQQQHRNAEHTGLYGRAMPRANLLAAAKRELAQMGLVRVSEKFRVIGITVPVPPYEGNPLDPPLRSRFQCLYVRTPLPVIAASTSVVAALARPSKDGDAESSGRKRSKEVAQLQERQSARFAEVVQLRTAITAINDATRDFQLSKPSNKKPTGDGAAATRPRPQRRYGTVYDSNDVVEEMFGEDGEGHEKEKSDSNGRSSAAAVASSPLQTVGHWALATIAQQLALFPDLPVGEAVMRGFPWPFYARQLTRSGTGGPATGYANVEEYHHRLAQYAEVLQHCHVYPPLLMAADVATVAPHESSSRLSSRDSSKQRRRSTPQQQQQRQRGHTFEPAAKSSRVGARLRAVLEGQGIDAANGEGSASAAARAFVRSAQLVSSSSTAAPTPTSSAESFDVTVVPLPTQQACNYILEFRHIRCTAAFSGVPVVVAEAVVATAAHDTAQPGSPGTYALRAFLGTAALPIKEAAQPAWRRPVVSYLTSTAAPATVFTTEHYHVLQTMLQVHVSRQHLCLLGPTGCGKTAMVRAFGRLLGYEDMLTMHLYAEMTNKDLFQQRTTDPQSGNTTWQDSPLLHAAIYGKLVVLDGMEKLPGGMLSSLQQILVDQSAVLADGTILKPPMEYTLLKEKLTVRDAAMQTVTWQPTDADMRARKIFPVHPAFRVVATARAPMPVSGGASGGGGTGGSRGSGRDFFVSQDLTTLFRIVAMPDAGEDALGPVLRQIASAEIRALQAEPWRRAESVEAMRQRSDGVVEQLLRLRGELETLHAADGKMPQLSLRQLRQLVRGAIRYPSRVVEGVRNTLLLPLMTGVAATKVQHALETCGLSSKSSVSVPNRKASSPGYTGGGPAQDVAADYEVLTRNATASSALLPDTAAGHLAAASSDRLWSVNGEPVLQLSRAYTQKEAALVPFVTGFHPNPVHESILAWLAKQYAMKSNMLLIGNQGVGKNKVVDAFLARLGLPRHYIQLHRDTTVGSLTINPTVEAGKVVWEDSPLVKAVQQGHCLVVDEIDKAPVEVVQVLKGLIEDREMRLSDGRQMYDPALELLSNSTAVKEKSEEKPGVCGDGAASIPRAATQRIAIHPDFRIIVLANPPGFPFHGNDFFRECGDLFAAYVMGNPDAASQLRVLAAYAPTLPRALLESLVAVFVELQHAFTLGNLTYPFSLRELIAVVKHMSRYPQDGVSAALNNVFNFDARDENTLRLVRQVLAHYLQPMITQGGLRRLRPYKAGQAVPLIPSTELVPLPMRITETKSSESKATGNGVSKSLVATLPAAVLIHSDDVLARILEAEVSQPVSAGSNTHAPLTWSKTYPTEAFFSSAASAAVDMPNPITDVFTEWASQCTLPFVEAASDAVLGMVSLNAVGGDGDDDLDVGGEDAATLPLLSVLLLRRAQTPPANTEVAVPSKRERQQPRLLVATARLPPSAMDTHRLVADTAEELAALWPIGHVRFVDVSAYFAAELTAEAIATPPVFQFAGLRLSGLELPWTASAATLRPSHGEAQSDKKDEEAGRLPILSSDYYVWPPSLAAAVGEPAPGSRSLLHRRGQRGEGLALEGHIPQAVLLLSAKESGVTVLVDVLAGAASDLFLARMGMGTASTISTSTTAPTTTRLGVRPPPTLKDAAIAATSVAPTEAAAPASLGPVLPLHLCHLSHSNPEEGTVAASSLTGPAGIRVLDVNATHGTVAFTRVNASATPSTACYFLQHGSLVTVRMPQPVTSLRFVGARLAMVTMAASTQAGQEERNGVLKVSITAEGEALASFLPLSVGPEGLELVEVSPSSRSAASNAAAPTLTPGDLVGSVWRRVVTVSGAAPAPIQVGGTQAQETGPAAVQADDDAIAPNVVYARVEEVNEDGLQLRYYRDPHASELSGTAAVRAASRTKHDGAAAAASPQPAVVDHARQQLLSLRLDGQTLTAIDTQHGTVRTFAPLPSTHEAPPEATAPERSFAVNQSNGAAYAWDGAAQRLSIADVDAERVRQRYTEWSSLLSGDARAVGDAASVAEDEGAVKDFTMQYSTPRKQPSGTLKHGEVDNQEHHGGNTWAGGTGGTDTAGLGGMVGPYRLDKGNPVYQVSPEEKRKVPQHLLEEARRMGREALQERLRSIGMSEAEYEQYKQLQERVRPAVAQLRTLLMGLKAAEGERVWVTGQTDGVWDDKKLVEGIVGEKNVYKRRVDSKDTSPFQQKYKKRLVFVLDVSASMYRFNSMDQRLTKLLETTVMVMEAFAGFESKLDYAMIGHNGDSESIPLVNFGAPPANQKERMLICQKMVAYAQYCWAGDNTVEAMRHSVELVTRQKGDAYFVFVVSDANLQRYGITPRELSDIIVSKPEVKMFCIFIATLGAQSSQLQQQLPAGHGFECLRTDALPQVMRQIFTSANLF